MPLSARSARPCRCRRAAPDHAVSGGDAWFPASFLWPYTVQGRENLEQTLGEVEDALATIAAGSTADNCESATLDFKREGRSVQDAAKALAEAATCFANARGGNIVVGVHDRVPGEAAFEGTSMDDIWLVRRIYELTTPPLTVEIRRIDREGKRLLDIRVPRSADVHQVDGRSTRRIATSCQPMSASQIAALISERRGEDWSAEDTRRPMSDVSATAVEQARTLLRASADPARRAYATESDEDLLRVLGLVTTGGTLNRAGELLLCEPEKALPLVVYQFRRTPGGEPVVTRPTGPILVALLRTLELVSARLDTTPVNLPGGQQLQLSDLPEPAIREAVANAAIHRDYRLREPVRIEHAPMRLTITSPGPLVQGVTLDNILTTPSRPRNAQLASAVRTLGLAEEAGVGVDRMYKEMLRVGHLPPAFEETADQVLVTLIGGAPNTQVTRYVATLPQAEADDADTMLTLHSLLTSRTVNAAKLAPLFQKGVEEAEFVLRRLAADPPAMLEPTRETSRRHHPNYRLRETGVAALGTAVTYRRRTTDEYDRKITELVRASGGEINGRMVQVALDLNTAAASRVIGDLVERQILKKTSEAQRGPGVTYGVGPNFPAQARRTRLARSKTTTDDARGTAAAADEDPKLFD